MCSPDSIDLANRAQPISKKCRATGTEGAKKRQKERERERKTCARVHTHTHTHVGAHKHTQAFRKGVCTVVTDHRRSKVLSSKGRFKASATRKSVVSFKSACALRAVAWAHCTGLSVTPVTLAPAKKKARVLSGLAAMKRPANSVSTYQDTCGPCDVNYHQHRTQRPRSAPALSLAPTPRDDPPCLSAPARLSSSARLRACVTHSEVATGQEHASHGARSVKGLRPVTSSPASP